MISYTHAEIEAHWEAFRKIQVYRYLVNGTWRTTVHFAHAKAMNPLKIEVKMAKDVMPFPDYLRATTTHEKAA